MTYLEELASMRDRIDVDEDLPALRRDILAVMSEYVSTSGEVLGRWEKSHIATALGALNWNINYRYQPSTWWLRYCVQNLWKAQIPASERSDHPSPEDAQLDALSSSELLKAIAQLRELVDSQ